jgi:hypothetical protein
MLEKTRLLLQVNALHTQKRTFLTNYVIKPHSAEWHTIKSKFTQKNFFKFQMEHHSFSENVFLKVRMCYCPPSVLNVDTRIDLYAMIISISDNLFVKII